MVGVEVADDEEEGSMLSDADRGVEQFAPCASVGDRPFKVTGAETLRVEGWPIPSDDPAGIFGIPLGTAAEVAGRVPPFPPSEPDEIFRDDPGRTGIPLSCRFRWDGDIVSALFRFAESSSISLSSTVKTYPTSSFCTSLSWRTLNGGGSCMMNPSLARPLSSRGEIRAALLADELRALLMGMPDGGERWGGDIGRESEGRLASWEAERGRLGIREGKEDSSSPEEGIDGLEETGIAEVDAPSALGVEDVGAIGSGASFWVGRWDLGQVERGLDFKRVLGGDELDRAVAWVKEADGKATSGADGIGRRDA